MFLPASATVEASLVIPLYIYAVLAVAYVIQIIGIKSTMYKAMYNSTRQLAAYAYAVERTERFSGATAKKAVTSALAKQYLLSSLPRRVYKSEQNQPGTVRHTGLCRVLGRIE